VEVVCDSCNFTTSPGTQHGNLVKDIKKNCGDTDQPRGAYSGSQSTRHARSTLVVWGGEFGRTPMTKAENDGRDHHPNAFTMWLPAAALNAASRWGKRQLGFNVVKDKFTPLSAATIRCICSDSITKLTYRFQWRDFRLTDVHGEVMKELLAVGTKRWRNTSCRSESSASSLDPGAFS